ncbi:helix-turn-helix domain-containing protein [Flavivirga jejuensis]|uniref:Helix-turn-helix domain-containing protein n=1 Tax=Flavivirga jejuensis TaxID=870487 RepID=A0ABT8WK46_9FLAO|nr:helix-turn-helix domain-containing protein [Flavivirga jejuensis]MDO5973532.1 helix-turn-helix domain-containing protein [Flavivirga jejuensis]
MGNQVKIESVVLHYVSVEEYQKLTNDISEMKAIIKEGFSNSQNLKLSIKEVAEELDVSELSVHNYIKKGYIKAFKIGRRVFIKRTDLDNSLKEVKSLKYKR